MKNKLIFILAFLLITSVSFVSSLDCNFPTSQITANTGETPSPISITCNNPNSSVQLWNQGNFFVTSPTFSSSSPLTINSNSSQSFTIIFNQVNQAGLFTGSFWSSDGLLKTINLNATQSNPTGCQINPSMSSYTQTAQTGGITPLPKITFNPTNCQGSMIYDSSHIYMEGGIISSGIRKPVSITSIVSDGVNLEINTEGLNSQTYTSTLKVSAFSKTFEIPFVIIVTSGNSQQGNFSCNSASSLPSCSLNSVTLNLNQTYLLTCSNLQTDVSINPIINNDYIKGIGLSTSSNQYVWNFMAKKIGVTNISACFNYLGSPCGDCFNQAVQVTNSGGSLLGGTILDFVFYQNGNSIPIEDLKSMDTIINVVDNTTRNLVVDSKLYINGIETNNTKTLETGKNYELRATAYGYTDKVVNFNVSAAQLTISINPNKAIYYVGEMINLTSNIENSTFTLGDVVISPYYQLLSAGDFVLKVEKNGYISSEMNITISPVVTYSSLFANLKPVSQDQFKNGDKILMKLTEDSIWNVYYEEEYKNKDSNVPSYKEPVIIKSGVGGEVSFEIKGNGYYEVKSKKDVASSESSVLRSLVTTKNLDLKEFWNKYWIWIVSVGGLLLAVIVFVKLSTGKKVPKGRRRTPMGSGEGSPSEFEEVSSYD